MMTRNKRYVIQCALPMMLMWSLLGYPTDVDAQDLTQGSGTNNLPAGGDPFQLPTGADDPFQLPGVPQLPQENAQPPAFQKTVVNDKYAGWQQVGDGSNGTRLDDILRAQWVMTDETGKLPGIVYGVEGADVGSLRIYLLRNGREVTFVKPKEDGKFVFPNVQQGTYSIVGWGDNAFFAFAINVIRFNEAADENVPTSINVTAAPNETTINTDWIKYFAQQVRFRVFGRYDFGEDETDPKRLYGVEGQSLYLPAARPATSISSHQVVPTPDGRVLGRIHQMSSLNGRPVDLRNTRVLLLKNDDVYAAVTTDSYGAFEFPELPSGEYTCVAVGQDGMGCIGIYLGEPGETGEDDTDFVPISFTMATSESTGWLHELAIDESYQRVITRPIYDYDQQQNTCSSCGQSGCNGGCAGNGTRALRPGGYRPPPRSSIPKDQRFFRRANRFVDQLFFRDTGTIPGYQGQNFNNGYTGQGVGGYESAAPAYAPAASPTLGGSANKNQLPNQKKR